MAAESTKFGLARKALGSPEFIALSEKEYAELLLAKAFVIEALRFEEKWELVVGNFIDLEKTLNDLSTEHMIQFSGAYESMNDWRLVINRRVMNMLATCRMYLDHAPQHLQRLQSEVPELKERFVALTRRQFDNSLAYRIAETMRNHALHAGLPVEEISLQGTRVERKSGQDALLYGVEAFIDVEALAANEKNSKKTREELRTLTLKQHLRPVLREYVACINRIHEIVRAALEHPLNAKEGLIERAIQRFREQYPTNADWPMSAVALNDNGTWKSEAAIFMKFIERRRYLAHRNGNLQLLVNSHISSEPQT
jgi:hypothetical protein